MNEQSMMIKIQGWSRSSSVVADVCDIDRVVGSSWCTRGNHIFFLPHVVDIDSDSWRISHTQSIGRHRHGLDTVDSIDANWCTLLEHRFLSCPHDACICPRLELFSNMIWLNTRCALHGRNIDHVFLRHENTGPHNIVCEIVVTGCSPPLGSGATVIQVDSG